MHYNDRLPGIFSASLPTLRSGGRGRGGHSDHARGAGRRVSSLVSRPAGKRARPLGISFMAHERPGPMRKLVHAIADNSLSIVLLALFVICISAESFAGWRLQNETLAAHGKASIGYRHFLSTGAFLEGLASNWQAAVLQLGSLVLFSSFLYQRGAPHSLDPRKANREKKSPIVGRFTWFYRHSLFLAFLLLFVLSLALHVVFGAKAYNEERSFTSRRSLSGLSCFRLSSGRQPCKPGRQNISRSRSMSCSPSFCASRTRRNRCQPNRATKRPRRRTGDRHAVRKKNFMANHSYGWMNGWYGRRDVALDGDRLTDRGPSSRRDY